MARPKKADHEKYIRQDVSMDPEQHKALLQYCQEQDRPISWVIRKALNNLLMCSNT